MAMDQATDLPALLPDGVLADVLGRLAQRDLAVSRSVCRAWRAAVDDHAMLRAELLPLSLAGLLINYNGSYYTITEFFARPSRRKKKKGPRVSGGERDFLADGEIGSWSLVLDHCNGLLLIDDDSEYGSDGRPVLHALNPATRRRARVPPCPPLRIEMMANIFQEEYLAYDPAVSPHYQVFSFPYFVSSAYSSSGSGDEVDYSAIEQSEWPPAKFTLQVFSSATGRWEERSFVRQGEAVGTVADMRRYCCDRRNAVYRRGQLYVHCQNFVMRISLSNDKYRVIKSPAGNAELYLGKSEKGIYCASFQGRCSRLQVWILNELCASMEWALKHDRDLLQLLMKNKLEEPRLNYYNPSHNQKVRGPWILQDTNYNYNKGVKTMKALVRKKFEWSSDASDDDETSECGVDPDGRSFYCGYFDILGFHPYKEIIFLSQSIRRGLAYHLNGSTIQDLGNLYPKGYEDELSNEQLIESSFPYTPCWVEQFGYGQSTVYRK